MFEQLLVVVLALMSAAWLFAESPAGGKRPNVLFFVSDDLRPELGCYGNDIIQSPNIDRLASRGIVFNRAYCQQAVCSPSRSSVMTGTRPDTTKVWDLETHFRDALPKVVTLPQLFKNNGYTTQGMGKIYHGALQDPPSWSIRYVRDRPGGGSRPGGDSRNESIVNRQTGRGPAFLATDDASNGGGDGALAEDAIDALRALKQGNKPFFLAVGFYKPHLPFVAPKAYYDLYDPAQIPLATNPFLQKGAPNYAMSNGGELASYAGVPNILDLPDDYARQLKHGYYAAVSYMDAQLGRVLDELDRLELTEETIVVLWGDHGWKLGEHNRWCKHTNVENDTNAPLIISVPGKSSAGQSSDALVEFVDIYPTIAQLAGLESPKHLEGTSLVPLIDDPHHDWKPAAFSQYPRSSRGGRLMGYSMRTDRYRFTRWVDRRDHSKVDAVELYDHETDPEENENIAADPANAELVAELTRQWEAGWQGAAKSLE